MHALVQSVGLGNVSVFNRDLELACDEAVIRHFGKDSNTEGNEAVYLTGELAGAEVSLSMSKTDENALLNGYETDSGEKNIISRY